MCLLYEWGVSNVVPIQQEYSLSLIRLPSRMPSRASLLVLGLGLLFVPLGRAQDAPSLTELKERYSRLGGLRASFTQVIQSSFSSDSTRIQGRVILNGNKYRVETPSQTVVTNGTTTWIYSPADSQVVVNDADSSASTITPQTFLRASTDSYDVQSTRSKVRSQAPHSVLTLAATDSSTRFTSATLWVRQSDRIVTRLRATDRNGSTLDLRLNEIVMDPSLEGRPFTFTAPDGVEVIDLRAESSE